MAAYRRVYDSRHLQADCQEPGSAPEPYARRSSTGYRYLYTARGVLGNGHATAMLAEAVTVSAVVVCVGVAVSCSGDNDAGNAAGSGARPRDDPRVSHHGLPARRQLLAEGRPAHRQLDEPSTSREMLLLAGTAQPERTISSARRSIASRRTTTATTG